MIKLMMGKFIYLIEYDRKKAIFVNPNHIVSMQEMWDQDGKFIKTAIRLTTGVGQIEVVHEVERIIRAIQNEQRRNR